MKILMKILKLLRTMKIMIDSDWPKIMIDSDWPKQNSGYEPITVSSQDSSQEGVYEVRYDAEDDHEDLSQHIICSISLEL